MRSRWTALPFAFVLFITAYIAANAGPLHDAVKDGDLARLQELISAGEDLEAQDRLVGTALHLAALTDNGEAAEALIEAGADVNTQARGEITALHIAAQRGSIEVAAVLIEAGADLEATDTGGTTPLRFAVGKTAVAALLLDAGADINLGGDIGGPTLLHIAADYNSLGIIDLLARSGVDIDEKTSSGRNPLINAVLNGHAEAVRTLLELGADVNGRPDVDPVFPSTPLELAIARSLDEIADMLRAAGATE